MKVIFIFASGEMKRSDEACLVPIGWQTRWSRARQHQAIGPIATCSTNGESIWTPCTTHFTLQPDTQSRSRSFIAYAKVSNVRHEGQLA